MRPSAPMYPATSLNESPYEKVGKYANIVSGVGAQGASMKVPTKK